MFYNQTVNENKVKVIRFSFITDDDTNEIDFFRFIFVK